MKIKRYNEAGDIVFLNNKKIKYNDYAYVFIIMDDKICFSGLGETHMDIMWEYGVDIENPSVDIKDNKLLDNYFGRIWIDKKVISFWNLKTNDFVQTLKDIQKEFYNKHNIEIDFFDGKWLIDVDEYDLLDLQEKLDEDDEGIYIDDLVINEYEYYSTKFYILYLSDYIKIVFDKGVDKEMDKKIYKLHLLDAKKKREELIKMGYKIKTRETSKLPPAGYRDVKYKYQFTEKFNSFQKLNENPNRIGDVFWTDEETLTFSYYFGKFFTDYKLTHWESWSVFKRNYVKHNLEYLDDPRYIFYDTNSGRGELSGRLFLESKIISFWMYPEDNKELKKVADDIKKDTGIDIWTDEWKIEVLIKQTGFGINWQGEVEIIPIKEYTGSGKRSEKELRISHTDDPQEKERKRQLLKQQGFKSKYDVPAKFDYYRRKHVFQEKFSNFKKLNESPDEIEYGNKILNFGNSDTITFGYIKNKMFVGQKGGGITHGDFGLVIGEKVSRMELGFPGRLWVVDKIISFWKYPEPDQLNKVLRDIEKNFNDSVVYMCGYSDVFMIEIEDEDIYIDDNLLVSVDFYDMKIDFEEVKQVIKDNYMWGQVIRNMNNILRVHFGSGFYPMIFGVKNTTNKLNIDDSWKIELSNGNIIPIKDYIGSGKRSEEELKMKHIDDPQEKERKKQILKQQGKEITGYKKSKYNVPAKYDYYKRKYQFQEKFNGFLNEHGDAIMVDGDKYNLDCEDSYPFVILNNKVYFGNSTDMHTNIKYKYNYNINFKIYYGEDEGYETMGRIWINKKIISFWTIKFKDIIKTLKDIQDEFYNDHEIKINFFDGEWRIDVNNKNEVEKLQNYLDKIDYYKYDYYLSNEYNYIISIDDYLKYIWDKNIKKELDVEKYKLHLLDAKRKREKLKKMGYKSKTRETGKLSPIEYKDKISKYQFTEKINENQNFNSFQKLNEDPDWVDKLKLGVDNGYPFTMEKYGDDFSVNLGNKGFFHCNFEGGTRGIYPGRLWLEDKVISFWVYPKKHEISNVLKSIQKSFRIKHNIIINFNDGWKIEVLKNIDEFDDDIITSSGIDNLYSDQRNYKEYREVLIPLEEYTGSLNQPEEKYKLHLLDAKRKQEELKKRGYKSKTRETFKKPPAIYRDDITKYKYAENFKFNNFK